MLVKMNYETKSHIINKHVVIKIFFISIKTYYNDVKMVLEYF